MVRIVTDSTADLSLEQQRAAGITVVPLNVHFGDEVFRDRVDLSSAEFFRKLKAASQLPRTSQPSVGVFEEVFRKLTSGVDEVVAVMLSGKVSGTYNAALMAAQAVPGKVDVVDSQSASMALGFLALEAARLASAGADRATVTAAVGALVPKARILCAIDTLTYLERGGRIGKARALVGSLLNFKPLITLRDGEVVPLGRARGRPQMLDRLVEMLRRDGRIMRLAVLHGAAESEAEHLRARLAPGYPELEVIVSEIGPVLATHTGPGVIGITYLTV
ncbi:MAG TPA: DegV family protein [Candidatus Dormibacteraeota bacterium]